MAELTEQELARLDKLNLIGQVAGSMGHEVKNTLTALKGFLQLLGSKDRYQEDRAYFDIMIDEVDRANVILNEFLYSAKTKVVDVERCSLNGIVSAVYPLINAEALKRDINLSISLHDDIPELMLNSKEIRQLILNLSYNAIQAMEPRKSFKIKTVLKNNEVILSVSDEGPGIPCEVRDKVGTPFVTTKERGTGLGLSVCYNIAQKHHAKMDFETGDHGTTFFVRFPIGDRYLSNS